MRGKWNHEAPSKHQELPEDNTGPFIQEQVNDWVAYQIVVHPEIAMQIAAGYHSPAMRDECITAFASTGTLTNGIRGDILREVIREATEVQDSFVGNILELLALHQYVMEAR